ncbi:MAG: TetR/AcrR family transcriptional regulator [Chloroflexi bacterium]|nr:TetR/AcrR family transcriptional regulator [Chloroflexota bacterium]
MLKTENRNGKAAVARAALALFAEKGVMATTTRDIARRAGVAEGTLYRHYQSKESLSQDIFRQCLEQFSSYLRQRVQAQKSTVGKFRVLVQAFFDFAQQEPANYSFVMFGHDAGLPLPAGSGAMPRDVVVELMRDGMEKGVFQLRDANLAAAMVIGALTRVIYFKQHGLIDEDYQQIVPQVAEACLRMISPEDIWATECC